MNRPAVLLASVLIAVAGAVDEGRSVQTPVFTGRAELTVLNVVITIRSEGFVGAPTGVAVRRIDLAVRGSGGERLHARTRREYVRPEE